MMIDRTFVAEEQNILNRLREQEAKVNGMSSCVNISMTKMLAYQSNYLFTFILYRRVQERRKTIGAKA